MDSSVVAFPRPNAEYRWYEMLDDSLSGAQINQGDVIECHLEKTLSEGYPHVLRFDGHTLVKYAHLKAPLVALISANPDEPTMFVKLSEVTIVGRVVRVFHQGLWHLIEASPAMYSSDLEFWIRWAVEQAS